MLELCPLFNFILFYFIGLCNRKVADDLRAGRSVPPEEFANVTIFFSGVDMRCPVLFLIHAPVSSAVSVSVTLFLVIRHLF